MKKKIDRVSGLESINYDQYSAVVISDYDKGFLTTEDIELVSRSHNLTFIDTKKVLSDWTKDINYVKINEVERKRSENYLNINPLFNKLITTVGSKGCEYQNKKYPVEKVEIKDLSGAGDSFLAALVYEFLRSKDINQSLVFANACATKVVQQKGVTLINDV